MPSLVEIGPVRGSAEDGFWISSTYFRYFVIISPRNRAGLCIWTNLNSLHARMISLNCATFEWNRPSCSGEEDFWISSMCFRYFVLISHWKRAGPFIWTNLNHLHPRMLCAFGSGELKDKQTLFFKLKFWYFVQYFEIYITDPNFLFHISKIHARFNK